MPMDTTIVLQPDSELYLLELKPVYHQRQLKHRCSELHLLELKLEIEVRLTVE